MVDKKAPELRFKGFSQDWEQRKLGDVVKFYSGLTYAPDNVTEKGTLVLRSSNVQNGEIIDADNVYVSSDVVNSDNVELGDIVVVVRNGSRNLIGKHALVREEKPNTVIGAFMTGVRAPVPTFTNALLDSSQFEIEISKNLGATINQITTGNFKKMQFDFPDRTEQEKIGSVFCKFDSIITLHQRKLDKTLSVRTGILESLFPSRNDDTPVLRVRHFNSKWNQCNLGDCFDERNEKSQDGELLSVTIDRGVVLTSSLNRVDNSSDDKSNYKLVLPNDIAYNSMRMWQGASGVSNFKGIVSPAYTVLKPKPNISSHFFAYMFKLRHMIQMFEKHSQGLTSDTWNLKFPALSKINVRIPESLEEQTLIVNLLQSVDQTIEYHQNKLVQLKQLKSVYLQKMFI